MTSKKITLRQVLQLLDGQDGLPDGWVDWHDIRPDGGRGISLRFMCEQETWIDTYATHPILIPWYECPVESLDSDDDQTVIWLDYEDFVQEVVKQNHETQQ